MKTNPASIIILKRLSFVAFRKFSFRPSARRSVVEISAFVDRRFSGRSPEVEIVKS